MAFLFPKAVYFSLKHIFVLYNLVAISTFRSSNMKIPKQPLIVMSYVIRDTVRMYLFWHIMLSLPGKVYGLGAKGLLHNTMIIYAVVVIKCVSMLGTATFPLLLLSAKAVLKPDCELLFQKLEIEKQELLPTVAMTHRAYFNKKPAVQCLK